MTDVTDGDEESVATGVQKAKQETVPVLPDTLSLKTLANIEKLKQVTVLNHRQRRETQTGKTPKPSST